MTKIMEPYPVFLERQWDPQRGTITLVASTIDREVRSFRDGRRVTIPGDRHAVTVPAATEDEALAKWRDWEALYRGEGGS